jgi:3',5'-cyclic AMP phosphodiesterase CpdA
LHLSLAGGTNARRWTLIVSNAMPGASFSASNDSGPLAPADLALETIPDTLPTVAAWAFDLAAGAEVRLTLAPPDAETVGAFRAAVISDIQGTDNADMYAHVTADPGIRFVVSAGDVAEQGTPGQYDAFIASLADLGVPFFATPGNHDLGDDPIHWFRRFGRANVHFTFKGAFFTLLDSGNATVDPVAMDWLEDWLRAGLGAPHVFLTHYPPFDPSGTRNGSFRSRGEAAALLSRLAIHRVAVTIYGHIHTYEKFSNAGIPAYLSGGGGGIQGSFDPFGRFYLVLDVATNGVAVGLVKIPD